MIDPRSAPLGDPVDVPPRGGPASGTGAASNLADEIKISHSVVAGIVRLSALEVEGVHSVGHDGIVDGLVEMLSKRSSDRGVKISEDGQERYLIELHVILRFGSELARVAERIQQNVRTKVAHMTGRPVAKIDVVIEGVRAPEPEMPEHDWHREGHTD
jgi:uncharacterized alkaline shock family protein YloU